MTKNEIKFRLQKILPKTLFSIILSIYRNLIKKILSIYEKVKLKSFEKGFKTVIHENISFEILINPRNGTVDNEIFLYGKYEPYFLTKMKEKITEGDIFVDIGANIGQHSLFVSQVVGDKGKVISFEPLKELYEQFKESVLKNNFKNIFLYNYGCGNKQETLNVYSTRKNMGATSLIPSKDRNEVTFINVVIPDTFLLSENKIDFIKIDVEGYELQVLEGLRGVLSKFHPKIFIEYSPYYYKEGQGEKIISLLKEYSYVIEDLENNRMVEVEDERFYLKNNIKQTNFLCT